MSPIPFHIVSGFLGSGKTTFLLEILSMAPAGLRLIALTDEFTLQEWNRSFRQMVN